MILTATEVTILSNISASAGTIAAGTYIEEVQEIIFLRTNNYFVTDLYLQGSVTFDGSAKTISGDNSFQDNNFLANDDIYVYNSFRNDGVYTIASVTSKIITLASASSIVDELSGRSVMISVMKWPKALKKIAAEMIAYDYDYRPKASKGVKSHSLGPFSESYQSGNELDEDGYPTNITDKLSNYHIQAIR